MQQDNPLIWVEISQSALQKNMQVFRELVGAKVQLAPMAKANAYGHGLVETGKIFRKAGADYLSVNALFEARKLREAGDKGKIYICGYTALDDLEEAVELGCELVIYNRETLEKLAEIGRPAKVHLKVETGTNRQGVGATEAPEFAEAVKKISNIKLVGVAMHFANIEDTTDHSYARKQLAEFNLICRKLEAAGHKGLLRHAANSAATLLWNETHFEIARIGIAAYGMWPSEETFVSLATERKEKIVLTPALTWKTRIAQLKTIPKGSKVGYGCAFEAQRETRLAILPVGYYDGYVRAYSEKASVLVGGVRAPVIGRICMNVTMVDVTDIPELKLEDEVILLGKSGEEEITAEEMGEWGETINYEVTTRIRENILRKVVE
ncbi:MAG: alanine racemase [Patescibacteria group bacterium]